MSKNRKRSPLPWLAAGAAGLITACIAYGEIQAQPMVRQTALLHATAAEILPAPLPPSREAMPERETFAVIVERPLFSPSRQRPSAQPSDATAPSLDLSLLGVVISTDQRIALVELDGDRLPVKQGDEISGWRVARIEPDRILVQHDMTERELLLDFVALAPPAPEPSPPQETEGSTEYWTPD